MEIAGFLSVRFISKFPVNFMKIFLWLSYWNSESGVATNCWAKRDKFTEIANFVKIKP